MFFSVIIPFYNVEKYADECVQSVLNQTYKNFELIAVDDGSTDSTGEILDKYASQDSRIRVIHKKNGGLTSARKAGARECKGDYAVIVDGDDSISCDYLEKFNNVLEKTPVDIITCGCNVGTKGNYASQLPFSVDGKYGYYNRERMEREYLPYLFSSTLYLVTKAYKRELYLKHQMKLDDIVTMGEDKAVSIPCISEAQSFYSIDEPLYYYRYNPDSMTKTKKKYLSWECMLERTNHIEASVDLGLYSYRNDFLSLAAHSVFNVVLSHIRNDKYSVAVKDAKEKLQRQDVARWINGASRDAKGVDRLLAVVLKYRLFFLMKLLTFVR